MSTVMYCWQVQDKDLWPVLAAMRDLYQRAHYA